MRRNLQLLSVILLFMAFFVYVGCGTKLTSPPRTDFEFLNEQYSRGPYTFSSIEAELKLSENVLRVNQKDVLPQPEVEETASVQQTPQIDIRKNDKVSEAVKEIEEIKKEVEQLSVEIPQDSVLHLIPDSTLGAVYCPSLLDLDARINNVAAELYPQVGPDPDLLAKFLANTFDAGFESLGELEDIGLDLDGDFAIFLTSIEPASVGAIIHLRDPDAIKTVIENEADESEPIEYNGVTYWDSDEGSYVILDDVLVYAQYPEVCENVIDIKNGELMPISQNTNYTPFLTTIKQGTEQVTAFFDLQSVIQPFIEEIRDEIVGTIDSLESDPDSIAAVPFIEGMSDQVLEFVEEINLVSISLQIEETDVLLSKNLHFKKYGKIEQTLKDLEPDQLVLINDLPNEAFVCGGVKANPEILFELAKELLKVISIGKSDEMTDSSSEIFAHIETMIQDITDLNDTFSDEMCFSVEYNESLIPDYLFIFDLKNEEKLKTYMNEKFIIQIEKIVELIQKNIEDAPQLSMFDGIQYGNSIMLNEVEIKSIVFPNFGDAFIDVDPQAAMMLPQEWQWSYTFANGYFYFNLGSPQQIQAALDSKAKIGESLAENISYQTLIEKLGSDNNFLYGFSPVTMANSLISIISDIDPNAAAGLQMFSGILTGIDENYSIGFAAKVQDGGIGAKLLITLGDFKQLINTLIMISGMDMLQ